MTKKPLMCCIERPLDMCSDLKQLKDPLYGYINIPVKLARDVIDSQVFQRLRRISQTSYAPLYPSATHTRFVHSLGVYYLGCYVANIIDEFALDGARVRKDKKKETQELVRSLEIFELACLLHDVGHAPFSHTGEYFFLKDRKYEELHGKLCESVGGKKRLQEELDEIDSAGAQAKPHEIMSCIVALENFPNLIKKSDEREFFARAICGYKYKATSLTSVQSFRNCLIELLNSTFIDVDKLDYLIRDAYLLGFQTVSIDYKRLLGSVRLKQDSRGHFSIAYDKNAVSVFENVVYAHDSERKWIQNHPVVRYEMDLLQRAIADVADQLGKKNFNVFSIATLTGKGCKLSDNFRLTYLCDADMVFLMKNTSSDVVERYFDRTKWYKPLWKSEVEYKALFSSESWEDRLLGRFNDEMKMLLKYLNPISGSCELDKHTLDDLKAEIKKSEANGGEDAKERIQTLSVHRDLLNCLFKWAKKSGLPTKFLILTNSPFESGFSKTDLGKSRIELPVSNETLKLESLSDIIKVPKKDAETKAESTTFYLFCDCNSLLTRRPKLKKSTLAKELVEELKQFFRKNLERVPA